jgi:hypothetical protein
MGLKRNFGLSTSSLLQKGQPQRTPFLYFNRIRFGRLMDLRRLNCLNMRKTPAQSGRDDQSQGDQTEISGLLSSRRMLPHFSDRLEFAFDMIANVLYPRR